MGSSSTIQGSKAGSEVAIVRVPALVVGRVAAVQSPAAGLPAALDPAADPAVDGPADDDPAVDDPAAEESADETPADDESAVAADVVAAGVEDAGVALSEPQAARPSRAAADNAAINADERCLAMSDSWAAAAAIGGGTGVPRLGVQQRTVRAYVVGDRDGSGR